MQAPDHFSSLNIRTGDEVENLSLVMADMERDLADYMERIAKEKLGYVSEGERIFINVAGD